MGVIDGFAALQHMFDAPIRKQQAMLSAVRLVLLHRFVKSQIDTFPVLRVNDVQESLIGSAEAARLDFKNPVNLIRPGQLPAAEVQFPASHLRQALRLF